MLAEKKKVASSFMGLRLTNSKIMLSKFNCNKKHSENADTSTSMTFDLDV